MFGQQGWRRLVVTLLTTLLATFVGMAATGFAGAAPSEPIGQAVVSAAFSEELSPARRLSMPEPSSLRTVGYVTSWGVYERDFQIADVDAARLTHLNYAFANVQNGACELGDPWADVQRPLPTDDTSLTYRGNFNQLQVLKADHPHLKTLLSVGGSTWSAGFSEASATASSRRAFVSSCVAMMSRYGFDGLDIDWEYPTRLTGDIGERADFTALIHEFRRQIDVVASESGKAGLLTIAAPAGPTTMAGFDIPALLPALDWVNVMAYDFAGPWSPGIGHNAPLFGYAGIEDPTFTVDSGMRRWLAAGAPASKLNLGLAFYGRGYGGVRQSTPGSAFTSLPAGTTEPGVFDFEHLSAGVLSNMTVTFDTAARVPYAYDAASDVWISFDDARSIEEKARYAAQHGLGGVMIWEMSNDADRVLLAAIRRGLAG